MDVQYVTKGKLSYHTGNIGKYYASSKAIRYKRHQKIYLLNFSHSPLMVLVSIYHITVITALALHKKKRIRATGISAKLCMYMPSPLHLHFSNQYHFPTMAIHSKQFCSLPLSVFVICFSLSLFPCPSLSQQ